MQEPHEMQISVILTDIISPLKKYFWLKADEIVGFFAKKSYKICGFFWIWAKICGDSRNKKCANLRAKAIFA